MRMISIIGATFIGNRGAEAMLTTTIGRIKDAFPDYKFAVFSYYPKDDKKLISDKNINIYSSTPIYLLFVLFPFSVILSFIKGLGLKFLEKIFPHSVVDLSNSKVLIDLAGVSFIDGRGKFLPFNILTILPAMILKVPVVKFSQAMGSFNNIANNLCARIFLRRCRKVFARGEKTIEFLKKINFNEKSFSLASDVAFLQKGGDSLTVENDEYVKNVVNKIKEFKALNRRVIGICPSSVVYSEARKNGWNYAHFLYELSKKSIDYGNIVLFFPNATRDSNMSKLRNNDLPIILKIVKKFDNSEYLNFIVHIEKNINTDNIKTLIRQCEITLVSRFHAMIASLETITPVFVLGWSHKYYEIMKQFELEEWVFDYKEKDLNSIFQKIISLQQQLIGVETKIGKKIGNIKRSSFRQFEYILDMLNK